MAAAGIGLLVVAGVVLGVVGLAVVVGAILALRGGKGRGVAIGVAVGAVVLAGCLGTGVAGWYALRAERARSEEMRAQTVQRMRVQRELEGTIERARVEGAAPKPGGPASAGGPGAPLAERPPAAAAGTATLALRVEAVPSSGADAAWPNRAPHGTLWFAVNGKPEEHYLAEERPVLETDAVERATATETEWGWAVSVRLRPEGQAALAAATRRALGRRLLVFANGVLVSAPTVREAIAGGEFTISGGFTRAEAEELAAGLAQKR